MNKSELIQALSSQFEGNKKHAQHALESVIDTITRQVAKGEKVAITGFGAFEKAVRPARMVRNPRTGERKRAKKTAVPKFRAGAEFKAVVAGDKKLPAVAAAASPTKKTATKSTAKKSAAKKSTAKKSSPAKKTAKKSTAKKTAKKSTAKKSTAKKASAKKTATKSSPAKKSTAKKTSAKKASAKKTAAKKSTAKKTAKKS